ncbi:flagellar-associated protein FlgQ [Campylobacter devanensis]|uniref:Flagellar-associated protein FlgQ n=1 Tax=Campylobacter devanensis TaxID=3161138 RepID=A0A1X9STS5_9BACT|nr:hypothetical protein [Campylobacter sp. P0138]ARQ99661.1 flagellar-associated protein FlgQ [Campylobacter lanienae]
MARTFCLLIFVLNNLFGGDEFIFWARLITVNGILSSDEITISRSMVKGYKSSQIICSIPISKPTNLTAYEYLNLHKNELFDCFVSEEVRILDNSTTYPNSALFTTELTITPIRFIVEFKPQGATISKIIR